MSYDLSILQNAIHDTELSKKIYDYNSLIYVYKFFYESVKLKIKSSTNVESIFFNNLLSEELKKFYIRCVDLHNEIKNIIDHDIHHAINQCENCFYFSDKKKKNISEILTETQNWLHNSAVKIDIVFDEFNIWRIDYYIESVVNYPLYL
jgi:hypothetical protein